MEYQQGSLCKSIQLTIQLTGMSKFIIIMRTATTTHVVASMRAMIDPNVDSRNCKHHKHKHQSHTPLIVKSEEIP
jgi:hypothetical protein